MGAVKKTIEMPVAGAERVESGFVELIKQTVFNKNRTVGNRLAGQQRRKAKAAAGIDPVQLLPLAGADFDRAATYDIEPGVVLIEQGRMATLLVPRGMVSNVNRAGGPRQQFIAELIERHTTAEKLFDFLNFYAVIHLSLPP
ncbi:MAG: hypothetical protein P8Y45_17095 [Exilibacterium sp.]